MHRAIVLLTTLLLAACGGTTPPSPTALPAAATATTAPAADVPATVAAAVKATQAAVPPTATLIPLPPTKPAPTATVALPTATPQPEIRITRQQVPEIALTAVEGFKDNGDSWSDDLVSFSRGWLALDIVAAMKARKIESVTQTIDVGKDRADAARTLTQRVKSPPTRYREFVAEPLPGLGEEAYRVTYTFVFQQEPGATSLVYFRRGNLVVGLRVSGGDGVFDLPMAERLARAASERLDAFIAKLPATV